MAKKPSKPTEEPGKRGKVRRVSSPSNITDAKITSLIVSAIKELKEKKGTTPSQIVGYISYITSNIPDHTIKKQVKQVLKRGLRYGILRRYRGQYFLPLGLPSSGSLPTGGRKILKSQTTLKPASPSKPPEQPAPKAEQPPEDLPLCNDKCECRPTKIVKPKFKQSRRKLVADQAAVELNRDVW